MVPEKVIYILVRFFQVECGRFKNKSSGETMPYDEFGTSLLYLGFVLKKWAAYKGRKVRLN